MNEIVVWLKGEGFLGLPHWGIVFFAVGGGVEYALGRSKNPRLRSLAATVATFLAMVTKPTLGKVPGVGIVVEKTILALVPQGDPCNHCSGTGLKKPTPEDIKATTDSADGAVPGATIENGPTKPESPSSIEAAAAAAAEKTEKTDLP